MIENIRELTEEEIAAYRRPESVNHAVLSDGVWYYADGPVGIPDEIVPIGDESGYVPLSAPMFFFVCKECGERSNAANSPTIYPDPEAGSDVGKEYGPRCAYCAGEVAVRSEGPDFGDEEEE